MSSLRARTVHPTGAEASSGTTPRRASVWTKTIRRAAIAVVCLLSSMMVTTPTMALTTAHAEPQNVDGPVGAETTLSWTSLGLSGAVTLVGANTNQDVKLPVPSGFTLRRLRGLIHAPVDFGTGFVEIDDSKGTFLATVELPAVTPSQAVVPFDVDISQALVSGSTVGLTFTVREPALPADQRCGLGERLVMSDLSVVFDGVEPPPSTISDFVPPVLQRLTFYAPTDADTAEQQAVLTLTSAFATVYATQSPAITVVNQPRGAAPPPAPQFTRAIVVERGDAGINVVNPGRPEGYLKVTGRGDQLSDQASLVVDRLQSLAQVPNARIDQAGSRVAIPSDQMTFGQLKLDGKTSVLRTADLTVGVDRSALGGRVDSAQVHLLATHTPVTAMDSASLMVSVNGQAVYTSRLGDSGRVDAVFEVPGEFLRQRINFDFSLTFSPRQLCSPTIAPVTFQLDPRSTLTVRRGGQALDGFSAVPSEFSPEFLVALDGSSPNQLDYASRVIADIARLTGTSLAPRVVNVKDAADATTAALIVANAATVKMTSLRPPIGGETSDVRVDLHNELHIDIDNGLGSIQAFADQPRNRTVILVTTSGAWSLIEPIFGYIDRLPGGWSSLDGNVAAAGAKGAVTNLSIGPGDLASPPPQSTVGWPTWLAIGAGCVVAAALALGAALWRRRKVVTDRGSSEGLADEEVGTAGPGTSP